MRRFKWAMLLSLLLSHVVIAEGFKHNVVFPKGETSTILRGSVIRGDLDTYILYAKANQTMTVELASLQDNAAFTIYAPNGSTLPNAGEGDDATQWNGELPLKGKYKIVVGGTRGNAEYALTIQIQ
ncbi:MAG: hypothetical protein RIT27_726 [Pseudomonadota bacterium]|jgi:hypothetical protein